MLEKLSVSSAHTTLAGAARGADSANTSVMAAPSDTTADVAGLVTDEDGEVNECVCVRVHVRVRVCV